MILGSESMGSGRFSWERFNPTASLLSTVGMARCAIRYRTITTGIACTVIVPHSPAGEATGKSSVWIATAANALRRPDATLP